MIDFHTHILPDIDDGSKNIEQSIEMLKECTKNGVDKVVLTPHCYYLEDDDIREYIRKRNSRYRELKEAMKASGEKLPEVLLGCELHFHKYLVNSAYLKELAIEGTDYILIEMPMGNWKNELYDALYSITLKGLTPIMAHIDRYLMAHEVDFSNLFSLELAYQVNCESFLMPGIKKRMPYLFESGAIHMLGSDMHNLTSRTTKMAECAEAIKKKYSIAHFNYLQRNAEAVLNNQPVEIHCFDKMGFMQKLKL